MVAASLAGVGDWAIGSSRAGLSLATRFDRGRNFVGFEEIFARRSQQRSGGHCVHIGAVEPEVEGLERQDHRHAVVDGMQHTRPEGKPFS